MNQTHYNKSVELIRSNANKFTTYLDTEIFNTLSLLTTPDNWDSVDSIIDKIKSLTSEKEKVDEQASFSLLILNSEYASNPL